MTSEKIFWNCIEGKLKFKNAFVKAINREDSYLIARLLKFKGKNSDLIQQVLIEMYLLEHKTEELKIFGNHIANKNTEVNNV